MSAYDNFNYETFWKNIIRFFFFFCFPVLDSFQFLNKWNMIQMIMMSTNDGYDYIIDSPKLWTIQIQPAKYNIM